MLELTVELQNGPDEGIRTPNPQFRRLMLYPLSYVRVCRREYQKQNCSLLGLFWRGDATDSAARGTYASAQPKDPEPFAIFESSIVSYESICIVYCSGSAFEGNSKR